MTTYEAGQTLTWGVNTYDSTGALANVASAAATITLPDGTTTAGAVDNTAVGTYVVTHQSGPSLVGRYVMKFTGSGANSGGLPYTDVADVGDMARLIVPLAEARAALNVPSGNTVNDDELRGYIAAATVVVEHLIGSVLVGSKVETHSGDGRPALRLTQHPTAITSAVEDGVTLPASGYCFDGAGFLWRGSQPGSAAWSSAAPRNVVATYSVGATVIPPTVTKAAANLIRHWWDQGLQQSYYVGGEPDMTASTSIAGYAVPNFVVDMLAPHASNLVPGFA
jgi:type IV secretory pathway protease TraF